MNVNNLTISEAMDIYQAITGQHRHEFAAALAKAAFLEAQDTVDGLMEGAGEPLPDVERIREHAIEYTSDMIADFERVINGAIAALKPTISREVKFN